MFICKFSIVENARVLTGKWIEHMALQARGEWGLLGLQTPPTEKKARFLEKKFV